MQPNDPRHQPYSNQPYPAQAQPYPGGPQPFQAGPPRVFPPVAGPGRRLVARIIDLGVVIVLLNLVAWGLRSAYGERTGIPPGPMVLMMFGVPFLYEGVQLVIWGRTLGKMVLGLRVVEAAVHQGIGAGTALLRALFLNPWLSAINVIPLLGFINAIITANQGRGWHDRVARTLVVDERDSAPGAPRPAIPDIRTPGRMIGIVASALAYVAVVAGLTISFFVNPEAARSIDSANAGDCVSTIYGTDVRLVACTDPGATNRVLGRIDGVSEQQFDQGYDTDGGACIQRYPETVRPYWYGTIGGQDGFVLCLGNM